METTSSGDHGDNMETTAMGVWGPCGDNRMMWRQWEQCGDDRDDMGTTGMWGP